MRIPSHIFRFFGLSDEVVTFELYDEEPWRMALCRDERGRPVKTTIEKALNSCFPIAHQTTIKQVREILSGYGYTHYHNLRFDLVTNHIQIGNIYAHPLDVYANGDLSSVPSCMGGFLPGEENPASVYGTADRVPFFLRHRSLALLFATTSTNKYIGRVLLWPWRRRHSHIYAVDAYAANAFRWWLFDNRYRPGAFYGAILWKDRLDYTRFSKTQIENEINPRSFQLLNPDYRLPYSLTSHYLRVLPHKCETYRMPFVDSVRYFANGYILRTHSLCPDVFVLSRPNGTPLSFGTSGHIKLINDFTANPDFHLVKRFTPQFGYCADTVPLLDYHPTKWNTCAIVRAKPSVVSALKTRQGFSTKYGSFYVTDSALERFKNMLTPIDFPFGLGTRYIVSDNHTPKVMISIFHDSSPAWHHYINPDVFSGVVSPAYFANYVFLLFHSKLSGLISHAYFHKDCDDFSATVYDIVNHWHSPSCALTRLSKFDITDIWKTKTPNNNNPLSTAYTVLLRENTFPTPLLKSFGPVDRLVISNILPDRYPF